MDRKPGVRAGVPALRAGVIVWFDQAIQDLLYAVRMFVSTPGFTAAAILTLALGIGATTTIFSVVNAVLLRPLPYPNASRLVELVENMPGAESEGGAPRRGPAADLQTVVELRPLVRTVSDIAVRLSAVMTLTGRREGTIRLQAQRVSPALFRQLGVTAALGRTFDDRHEATGADGVLVLSHAAWQRYFQGAPQIIGQALMLDERQYAVIGVMPRGFQFPNPQTELWVPFILPSSDPDPSTRLTVTALVKDGVSIATAEAEVSAILTRLRPGPETPPSMAAPAPASASAGTMRRFELVPVQDRLVAPVRHALRVLTVAVSLVLLIACVNVANLLLARTAARRREIAVRRALGAGRGRLIRQVLTESVLLASAGALLGTGLAFGGVDLLRSAGVSLPRRDLGPGVSIPRLDEIAVDPTVLIFTAATSLLTALLFGLGPAIRHANINTMDILREGTASSGAGFNLFGRQRMQAVLIVSEIAMATTLLIGGGLLMFSFVKLSNVERGYDTSNVLTFVVGTPYGTPAELPEALIEKLRALPGVRAAGYAGALPMVQVVGSVTLRGPGIRTSAASAKTLSFTERLPPERPNPRYVSKDFHAVMGTRVIAGRGFADRDVAGQPRVMLINETLARSGILGDQPIGKQVYAIGSQPWEIVGIVQDTRELGLDLQPNPQIFIDCRQVPGVFGPGGLDSPYYAVRLHEGRESRDLAQLAADIRAIVRQMDPVATLDDVATMDQILSNSVSRRRLYTVLLATFAVFALVLAAIGIYSVIAYAVGQRRREIGIRMALGATGREIVQLVLRQSVLSSAAGLIIGIAGAAVVTRYLEGMLFGLTPLDATTFVVVPLLFAGVATFAAFVPARRASNVDPLIVLRQD
jgi:putative ABC transport system permease protein